MTNDRLGRVLVAGAINTDLVAWMGRAPAAGETITGQRFDIFGGGKGANQAVAAARSGAAVTMLGAVGTDDFGRQRLADLHLEGIQTAAIAEREDQASGVALIFIEEGGENRIAYVPGATLSVSAEEARRAFAATAPTVVLMTLELPPDALSALLDDARATGAVVIVNATPEPSNHAALARRADILIVNQTEAAEQLGGIDLDADTQALTKRLAEQGPRAVIITLGAEGAVLYTDGTCTELPAREVEVVDTTGAGDALCGALAAALAAGEDLAAATETGLLAGAVAVTRAGAQPSMPTRAEIDALR